MARMYSRRKGKSGSNKPIKKTAIWVRYKPKEIEMLITKLAKEGKSASEIGLFLRDSYGIPNVKSITGKRITIMLKEKNLAKQLPEDLLSLIKKSIAVRKHLEENHKDMAALRGLQLTESKMRRLIKYYKKTKVLPVDWKFDAKSVRMYVE
ncbi:30S ribosomal protein S15 [Candidatus Woesearchaeota archaeon CG10_big_fil_rev_8_21_14_0_10_44_13]|nr:MAG: 30S ribosomal protein S15 [Candidatus Woesearchaeota archaeon CG10_big_fil_rev_8_21_14_0_10_44_13]